MNHLKLFVVGESSYDPEEWCAPSRAIVIAHNENEALSLAKFSNRAIEIPITTPMVICAVNDIDEV